MKQFGGIILGLVALGASACVSQGSHDRTLRDLDLAQQELAASKDQTGKLSSSLADSDKRVQDGDAQMKKLQDAIAQLEAQRAALTKDQAGLRSSLSETKAALADAAKRKAESEARMKEYQTLVDRFRPLIDAGKLQVKIINGRMVVALASDVLFSSGQATLSKEGESAIGEVAKVLATIPERKFQVEGHTDNIPIRTAQYPSNWELASARAITVVRKMAETGLPASRVSAASYASEMPAKSNDTAEGRAANRRIEIVVIPDLSGLPGFDELNRASVQK